MTKNDLMRMSLNHYEILKELSISKRQFELIHLLNGNYKTSKNIADKYSICVQNASQQLSNLYKKGYLIREEVIDVTGGYIYRYTSNPFLFTGAK